jgi:hypothetical protein
MYIHVRQTWRPRWNCGASMCVAILHYEAPRSRPRKKHSRFRGNLLSAPPALALTTSTLISKPSCLAPGNPPCLGLAENRPCIVVQEGDAGESACVHRSCCMLGIHRPYFPVGMGSGQDFLADRRTSDCQIFVWFLSPLAVLFKWRVFSSDYVSIFIA